MNEIVSYDSYRLECLNIDFYNISPRPILVLRADFIFLDSNVLYVRNKQYERLEKSTRLIDSVPPLIWHAYAMQKNAVLYIKL